MLNLLFSSMFTRFLLGSCSVFARFLLGIWPGPIRDYYESNDHRSGCICELKGAYKTGWDTCVLNTSTWFNKKDRLIGSDFFGEQLALHFSLDKLFPTLWWGFLDSRCHIVAVIDSVMTADKRIINKGKTEFTCGGGWFSQGCRQRWHSQGHRGLRQRQHLWCYVSRCVCSWVV